MATPEQMLRQIQSQRNLRQQGDRNVLLQRQKQIQQLNQQIQQQQVRQQALEQQRVQETSRESLKQSALSYLLTKGRANEAFRALSPQEQAEVQEQANELEGSKARVQAERQVVSIEEQLGQKLSPQVRSQLIKETLQTGQATLSISQFQPTGNLYQGPVPRGYSQEAFRVTGQLKPIQNTLFQGPTQRFQDEQYFRETGKYKPLPLVVSKATGTFQDKFTGLKTEIKEAYKRNDLPQVVRSVVGGGAGLFITEGARRTAEALQKRGVAREGLFATKVSFPTERVIGDIALGSLLVGLSGSSQIGVSRYVKNGVVYEIDSAGNVISARSVSQVNKEITDFKQALEESAIFQKAGSRYYNEPNLREKTRELINKANPQQLEKLRNFYKQSGRSDLFNDILAQEKDLIVRTNKVTQQAVKDQPAQLTGAGQLTATSKYAGTGQYERTEQVVAGIPQGKIQNPSLMSNLNVAFGQSNFDRQKLNQVNSLGLSTLTSLTSQQRQDNVLGLRSETQIKQGSRLGSALFSASSTAQRTQQQQRLTQRQALDFFRNRARRTPRPPKTPFGFNLPDSSTSLGKTKSVKDVLGFAVEVRRKGKFNVLGNAESSLQSALMKAQRYTDTTLARSFRIRSLDTGELVSPSSVSPIFRASKREAKTFIELPKYSLGGSEQKEIKLFKKSRRSKNVFGI